MCMFWLVLGARHFPFRAKLSVIAIESTLRRGVGNQTRYSLACIELLDQLKWCLLLSSHCRHRSLIQIWWCQRGVHFKGVSWPLDPRLTIQVSGEDRWLLIDPLLFPTNPKGKPSQSTDWDGYPWSGGLFVWRASSSSPLLVFLLIANY